MNIIRSSLHNFTRLPIRTQALKSNGNPFFTILPYSQSLQCFIPHSPFHTSASLRETTPSVLRDKANFPKSHCFQSVRGFCQTPRIPFREETYDDPIDKTKFSPFDSTILVGLIVFIAGCIFSNPSAACQEEDLSAQELEQLCAKLGLDGIDPENQSSKCLERAYQKCQEGDWETIEQILSLLSRLKDSEGNTLLTIAIKKSDANVVENLLERDFGLHEKDKKGNTPLHIAAKYNCFSIVPLLLKSIMDEQLYFDPNVRNNKGETPLHIAIKQGHNKVIGFLVEKSDLKKQKKDGNSILHLAVSSGQFPILDYLFLYHYKAIANMIEEENRQGFTPLCLAAYLGEAESLYILKNNGANIQALDKEGNTPLHLACQGGRKETIDRLIALQADVKAKNIRKESPKDLIDTSTSKGNEIHAFFQYLEEDRSRAKDPSIIPIKNLVFQGGGPKGIAYIIPLQEMEERKLLEHVERVAGASAGAIIAALVAVGYSGEYLKKELGEDINGEPVLKKFLDYPPDLKSEIEEILEKIEKGVLSQKFKEGLTINNLLSGVYTGWKYFRKRETIKKINERGGLCSGDFFLNWIEQRIEKATGIKYCTFGELKELVKENTILPNGKKAKHLCVVATSLEDAYPLREFSSENSDCDTLIISDTIRMSMSIPLAYQPHRIHRMHIKNGKRERVVDSKEGYFIDGGLLNNFPIDLFDRKRYKSPKHLQEGSEEYWNNYHTVGFSLEPASKAALKMIKENCSDEAIRKKTNLSPSEITELRGTIGKHSFSHVVAKTGQILYDAEPDRKTHQEKCKHRVVTICDQNIGLLEFNLSKEKEVALFQEATKQTQAFFKDYSLGRLVNRFYNFGAFKAKEAQGILSLPLPSQEFSGRMEELEELEKRLLQNSEQQTFVAPLVGKRGSGKSELAITFAALHVEKFSLIWQIDYRNPEALEKSYKKLGKALTIANVDKLSFEKLQEEVNQRLENYKHSESLGWLLIFDNVDSQSIPLLSLPKKGGSLLITSTDNTSFIDQSPLPIEGLDKEASQELMKKIMGKNEVESEQLAEDLRHIPLLIRQAASYIAETGITVADYRSELLKKCPPDSDYDTLLKACWGIAATNLQNLYPETYDWLLFSSFLDNKKIPQSWLQQSLKEKSYQAGYEDAQKILESLSRYNLISFYPYNETFSLHGYFQEIVRISQAAPEDTLQKVLNRLPEFSEVKDYNPTDLDAPKKFENILPHCLSVLEHSKAYPLPPKDLAPLSLILIRYFIETKRDLIQAEKYLLESNLEGPALARVKFFYGIFYSKKAGESNDPQVKEQLYENARQHFKDARLLFDQHPEEDKYRNIEQNSAKCNQGYQKAICLEYEAQALINLGDFKEAENKFDAAFNEFRDLYGKEHFDIARIERERGKILLKKDSEKGINKILEAIEMQKRVYKHRFLSHKTVGATFTTLGEAYELCTHLKPSEKMKEADKAYENAIFINTRAYRTGNVFYNIHLYEKRAKIAKALGLVDKEQEMLNNKKNIEEALFRNT